MLETLKARKEALQAQGKKGFTLMEMLIVIAIIAVLIAIAIPVFGAQLDNAKKAADEANARSIYAIAMADYMDNNKYDFDYTANDAVVTVTPKAGVDGTTQTFNFSDKAGAITIQAESGAPSISLGGYSDVSFGATS